MDILLLLKHGLTHLVAPLEGGIRSASIKRQKLAVRA